MATVRAGSGTAGFAPVPAPARPVPGRPAGGGGAVGSGLVSPIPGVVQSTTRAGRTGGGAAAAAGCAGDAAVPAPFVSPSTRATAASTRRRTSAGSGAGNGPPEGNAARAQGAAAVSRSLGGAGRMLKTPRGAPRDLRGMDCALAAPPGVPAPSGAAAPTPGGFMTPKPDRAGDRGAAAPPDAPAVPPKPPRALLWVALGLLVAGFAVALYAFLYRPDYVVLVRFDDLEEGWFRTQIADFAEKRHVHLTTRSYRDGAELERLLRAEALERKSRVLAALVPQSMLSLLAEEDLVVPLDEVRGKNPLRAFLGRMAAEATAPASARGRAHYVPATISTPLLFYSKRQLADP